MAPALTKAPEAQGQLPQCVRRCQQIVESILSGAK